MVEEEQVSERITRTVLGITRAAARRSCTIRGSKLQQRWRAARDRRAFPPIRRRWPRGCRHRSARPTDWGMVVMPLQVEQDLVGVIKAPPDSFTEETRRTLALSARSRRWSATSISSRAAATWRCATTSRRHSIAASKRISMKRSSDRAAMVGLQHYLSLLLRRPETVWSTTSTATAGSRTLQEVAKRILNAVRGIDKVVRFGGDELCRRPIRTRPSRLRTAFANC